ncbi:MAG TPA: hypothetical protein VF384_18960 [Planctomycetota bacterium]
MASDPTSGVALVTKVFVAGSMAEAEYELAMARLAAGPGVVVYRDAGIDAATNRPCVTMNFEAGTDLDSLVAESGALPAALACRLMAPVAATLARLHGLRVQAAPAGICHGDVKPRNLLRMDATTLLLDFEHTRPIAASRPAGAVAFTGGSHGFSPPEASRGAPPDAAFDVYGLGATLDWLLRGGHPTGPLQHADVVAIVRACMAANPAERPGAAALATTLATLADRLEGHPDEAVLDDAVSGRLEHEPAITARVSPAHRRCWRRCHRLAERLPGLLRVPSAQPTEPATVARELRVAARVLARFPRHLPTLRWRRDLCRAAGTLLARAAEQVTTFCRAEEFAPCASWLEELEALVKAARALPCGCPIQGEETPATVGLLHRDPIAFLRRLGDQLAEARRELAADVEAITAAERQLDLRAAEAAVDRMAARLGGASPTAARRRDQLHRLGFYFDRVARAEPNVESVGPLWDAVALQPLMHLVKAAATACQRRTRSEVAGGAVGLRSLQITLANLAEEFPHLQQVAPAHDVLSQALAHLTEQAWALLADAQQKLQAVPVPVRPLQLALGRLDSLRILEAFVDRGSQPRGQLQDGIEALRLRIEQARATRDRLAEGAEQALSRGHWTTGLFDMERAVAGLQPGDEHERGEVTRLRERVEEVRRRKREVDAAVRRNVELASLYGMLQDDPSSTFANRLQVLNDRRDCLLFLTVHMPEERGVLYGRDLRDVETQIALEQTGLAEHQLDGTVDADDRLRLARATLERLTTSVTAALGNDPPGRMVRLLEHWRTVTAHCQRAVEQLRAERAARTRHRRRLWAMAAAALLVSTTAVGLAVRPWLAQAAERSGRSTASELAQRVAQLPPDLRPAAEALLAQALPGNVKGPFDYRAWHDRFREQLRVFVAGLQTADSPTSARAFAIGCWDAGLDAAISVLDDASRSELLRMAAELANEPWLDGLQPDRLRTH